MRPGASWNSAMEAKLVVGIRYCGGCNPRYDRVALVQRLRKKLPQVTFVPAEEGRSYDALLLCQGCPAQCAPVDGLVVPPSKWITLSGDGDYRDALTRLSTGMKAQNSQGLTHQQILDILPHRNPLCLIDTVEVLAPGESIQATWTPRREMTVFQGHFPEHKILPGVYLVEAMAQAADIIILKDQSDKKKLPLLMEIRKAQIRQAVHPGDCLNIHADLLAARLEYQLYVCRGQVFRNRELVAETEMTLSLQ
ncbi:3-hydroxyacyl-[acyl-carrier-protein] dehydratase [Eubacterium aggregans]|uniref:3-hydroxyacyl-[acyl-carrier-protein] dehydratase n=1 Tax=Eubacterium aggregans TaxID=81409 RepID=A0A1H3WU62_9FIRM|nr:hypothetical protein [Eubacterium aggregans]SDZ90510.1 3-hydroxyacyl-[acyl-carrier-protein] dehydratase [Eubacterium aggregans]